MRKKERYEKVIAWFQDNIPVAETELHYNNPYELLIAVILSAQCTDKRVNIITPPLYKDFPTPEALAATTPEVIFEYIRSVSYPNNKAKHLVGMAKMLVNDFNSEVPDNLEDLIKLPGVGRKTANVIQSVVFKKSGNGGRYTRVPCQPPYRTGARQLHHPVQRGKRTGEEYSGKAHTDCPSLAHPSRPLRLSGTYSQM